MATEVEKLRKEVASLEARKSEHERKHAEAGQRKTELESRRQVLLAQIADGDDGARRDLRRLDGEKQEAEENEQAFAAAGTKVALELETAREALGRAQGEAAITALEGQIALLAPLDNEVEAALALVKQRSEALFSATKEIAAQLNAMDATRYDDAFAYKLGALIKESIWHRLEEMHVNSAERRPSFIERATPRLHAAIEQLKYESLQGQIVPGKREKLYRTVCRVRGLRNLDLRPGSLIALREDEAAPLLDGGSLELVVEQIEQSGTGEEAA
jgi:DNA repair exonuclease SbcCD ATPase subunit